MSRTTRRAVLAVALALQATACSFDEAELIRPGTAAITADIDELRVLSYPVDPAAGDQWIDVLAPDPTVVEEADEYREDDGARLAEADEAATRRRLFTAVGAGRTLLVEVNCVGCRDGRPATAAADTPIHVWDFVVSPTTTDLSDRTEVADTGATSTRRVGQYLVVVREGDDATPPLGEVPGADDFPLDLVAFHPPEAGADLWVHVYLAVRSGEGELIDPASGERYAVRVTT